ncbi:hypothetical protein HDU96_000338 [Phlyctochytrium bullatum]|nr:hypothetical protein HDU96_000338 [Phlyctochytrium bullatum]
MDVMKGLILGGSRRHGGGDLLTASAMGSSTAAGHSEALVADEPKRPLTSDPAPEAESDSLLQRRRLSDQRDSLHIAAERNDTETVLKLLEQGHDPYEKDADGYLPIQLATSKAVWRAFASQMHTMDPDSFLEAVDNGDGVATRLLLSAGRALVAPAHGLAPYLPSQTKDLNGYNITPLQMACLRGQVGTARILLERGANKEERTDGLRPLHFAVFSNCLDVITLLLDYGAIVQAIDDDWWSALHYAAFYGFATICEALLNKNAGNLEAKEKTGETAMHKAVTAQKVEVVKVLLAKGANINAMNAVFQIPVVDIRKVDVNVVVEVFKVLANLLGPDFAAVTDSDVAKNKDANDSEHPFRLTITAAQQHQDEVPVSSEAKRQAADAQKEDMLGKMDVLAQAAESEAVPNPGKRRRVSEEGDSLHAAAKRNDMKAVLNLLQQHHDPYQKDAKGRLPIQLATSKTVWGAFASKMNTRDLVSFLKAVDNGDGVAARLHLAAGADPTARDDDITAVHIAAARGHTDVLEALLDSAKNPKSLLELTSPARGPAPSPYLLLEDFGRISPLQLACIRGEAGTARILLERGANVNEQTKGVRPLHFAASRGQERRCCVTLKGGGE